MLWNWNGSVSFQLPIVFYDSNGVPGVQGVLQLQDIDGTQFITQAPTAFQMDAQPHALEVLYVMAQSGGSVGANMASQLDGAGWVWTDKVIAYPGHAFAPALNNGAPWFSGWPGYGMMGSVLYQTRRSHE